MKTILHENNITSHYDASNAKPRPESMALTGAYGKIKQSKIREPINDTKEDSKEKNRLSREGMEI